MADPRQAGTGAKSVIQPVAEAARKAAKAGKIKSIKLKIKFGSRRKKNPTADFRG